MFGRNCGELLEDVGCERAITLSLNSRKAENPHENAEFLLLKADLLLSENQGVQGVQGVQGAQGAKGAKGAQGTSGHPAQGHPAQLTRHSAELPQRQHNPATSHRVRDHLDGGVVHR